MPGVQVDIKAKDNASKTFQSVEQNATGAFGRIGSAAKNALGGGGSTRVGAGAGGFSITGSLAGISGGMTGLGIAAVAAGQGLWTLAEPARQFESTMSKVQAIMQPSTAEFTAMELEAKRLGATTSFTAKQSAEAYVMLGQAGLTASESVSALEPTLNAAAAGGMSLASAADIGTNVMATMGLGVEDLTHVMDGLATAATTTNTDVSGIANAMKYGGQVAKLAGLDFDETTAALGLLANEGLKGSSAGTALSNALLKMQDPTEKATKILESANIQFVDMNGKLRPLPEIVNAVKDANLGASEMAELFGKRGLRAMAALTNQGGPALEELTEKIKDSDGAAKNMADTMLNNVDGAVVKFQSALEGLRIALFEGTNPAVQELVEWLTQGISDLTTWIEEMKSNKGQMALWKAEVVLLKDQFVLLWELLENGFQGAWNIMVLMGQGTKGLVQIMSGDWAGGAQTMSNAWKDFKDDTVANNGEIFKSHQKMRKSIVARNRADFLLEQEDRRKRLDNTISANEELLRRHGFYKDDEQEKTKEVAEASTKLVEEESEKQLEAQKEDIEDVELSWDGLFDHLDKKWEKTEQEAKLTSGKAAKALGKTYNTNFKAQLDDVQTGINASIRAKYASAKDDVDINDTLRILGRAQQKVAQDGFNKNLRSDFQAGVKKGLENLVQGDFGGFFKSIGSSILGAMTGRIRDNVSAKFTNAIFGGPADGRGGSILGPIFRKLGGGTGSSMFGGLSSKLSGLIGGGGGGALGKTGGLAGILTTAFPAAAALAVGVKFAGPIFNGMKQVLGKIGGFVSGIFGGKKATIESAWDPRILERLFAEGHKVGDKVSKDRAKAIAKEVGAGKGLSDGFSFYDMKGAEEKRDRQRTNEQALEESWRIAGEKIGLKRAEKEAEKIEMVKEAEIVAAEEVKVAEIEFAEEASEKIQDTIAANLELHNERVQNEADLYATQVENAQAIAEDEETHFQDTVAADQEYYDQRIENETELNAPTTGLRSTNENSLYELRTRHEADLHAAQIGNVQAINGAINSLINKIGEIDIQAIVRDNLDVSGGVGDEIVKELQRRSFRGDQIIYPSGVQ